MPGNRERQRASVALPAQQVHSKQKFEVLVRRFALDDLSHIQLQWRRKRRGSGSDPPWLGVPENELIRYIHTGDFYGIQ